MVDTRQSSNQSPITTTALQTRTHTHIHTHTMASKRTFGRKLRVTVLGQDFLNHLL